MSTESKASGSMFDAVKWLVALVLFAGAVAGASDAFYQSVGVEMGTLYRVLIVVAFMLLADRCCNLRRPRGSKLPGAS